MTHYITMSPRKYETHAMPIPAAKAIVKKPVAVYIEKVYELGDFAALGIGTLLAGIIRIKCRE